MTAISSPVRRSVNEDFSPLTDDESRALINSVSWYHRFELRPGLVTPGVVDFPAGPICDSMGIPEDLTNLRVLDIGTWDGPLAFEMERRGAEVVGLDIQDPTRVGFAVARRILRSRVVHIQASVYDLSRLGLGQFDHIAFRGIYYHLKYPLLAFEQLGKALKLGGRLHFEGEAALNYVENLDGQRVDIDLATLARLRVPLCFSYPNQFKNASNWFIPNLPCMEGWLTSSGFKAISIKTWESDGPPHGGQRMFGIAEKANAQNEQLEHPFY